MNLNETSEARLRRLAIWRHNGLHGGTHMALAVMRNIQSAPTTTDQSRRLAANIEASLVALANSMKERRP